VTANKQIPVLIPPDKGSRGIPRRGWTGGRYSWMRNVLATEHGRRLYRKRKQTVEPLFGNTKQRRRLPLPQAGQGQGAHRVAITDADPQPHQASPPPTRRNGSLKQARPPSHRPHPGHTPDDFPTANRASHNPTRLSDSLDESEESAGRP
jgi:hypothetical protein